MSDPVGRTSLSVTAARAALLRQALSANPQVTHYAQIREQIPAFKPWAEPILRTVTDLLVEEGHVKPAFIEGLRP